MDASYSKLGPHKEKQYYIVLMIKYRFFNPFLHYTWKLPGIMLEASP